ncbi:MAG: hypothetical protein ACTJIH_13640 [Brevibacterium aurantiacum]
MPTGVAVSGAAGGRVTLERIGLEVILRLYGCTVSTSAQISIASGFRPAHAARIAVAHNAGIGAVYYGGAAVSALDALTCHAVTGTVVRWTTKDPLPAALPGTPG